VFIVVAIKYYDAYVVEAPAPGSDTSPVSTSPVWTIGSITALVVALSGLVSAATGLLVGVLGRGRAAGEPPPPSQ
jgi:hypothetical protein